MLEATDVRLGPGDPIGGFDLVREVVDAAPDAMLAVDIEGRILFANRQCEVLLGWKPSDLVGHPFQVLLPPGSGQAYELSRASFAAEPRSHPMGSGMAFDAVRPDGSLVAVDLAVTPIQSPDGAIIAVAIRDATLLRQVEQQLLESEARTKKSLDRMLDGFAILRSVREAGEIVDFEWTYINLVGAAAYDRSVEATIGTRMSSVMPGIIDSGVFDEFCHVVNTGEPSSKLHSAHIDATVDGLFDLLAWKLDDGFAITWRDVTDRERATAALESTEERFRASVEHLYEALSVFTAIRDDAGQIVDFRWEFANAAASVTTGYSPDALTGRTLLEVLPAHGLGGLMDVYRNVVESGQPYVDPSLWYEDVWGDGRRQRRVFDVRASKLDDGFVVVSRDVTEVRQQEQDLVRQRDDLERSYNEIARLNELADMLQTCATSEEAYSVVIHACTVLFPGHSGSISLMNPANDVLESQASWGPSFGRQAFPETDCWALRRGRPYVSGPAGPRCRHLAGSPIGLCLCVPMIGQSETVGVLHLAPNVDQSLSVSDLETGPARQLAVTVAGQLSMAFANLRLRDSLRELSIRDPLTGLFNRRFMEEALDRELSLAGRSRTEVGVVAFDIDHFKDFNDLHGHDAGDAVLEAVGKALAGNSRPSDVACRYGGEEFLLILPNCSPDNARIRAEEVRRLVSELTIPFRRAELTSPTISCGVAGFPEHGRTAESLLRSADTALYAAKDGGRDRVSVAPGAPNIDSAHEPG